MNSHFTPHPWNQDFAWRPATSAPAALTPEQTEDFNRQGFFVMEDLLDADTVAAVVAEIDAIEAETEAGLHQIEGERLMIAEAGAITFTPHLVARSNTLRQVAADPRIGAVCLDLVGPDVNLYWDQAVYKKPEKPRRFPWHQDNGYTFIEPPRRPTRRPRLLCWHQDNGYTFIEPQQYLTVWLALNDSTMTVTTPLTAAQQYLTVWLALNDATVENGCPWVAPGVHLHGTLAHTYVDPLGFECFEQCENPLAAPVPAGGAVVFSSLTPHLTGPNTTAGVRKAYILQYAPAGAELLTGDPTHGPPTGREPCDAPERQYAVTRSGAPVTPDRI